MSDAIFSAMTVCGDLPDPHSSSRHRLVKGDRVRYVCGDQEVDFVVTDVDEESHITTLRPHGKACP